MDLQYYAGMPVVVNNLLYTEEQIQVKTHRRKRINKKWRKRYGFATVRTPTSYIIAGTLYVHPTIFHAMKETFVQTRGDPEILVSGGSSDRSTMRNMPAVGKDLTDQGVLGAMPVVLDKPFTFLDTFGPGIWGIKPRIGNLV